MSHSICELKNLKFAYEKNNPILDIEFFQLNNAEKVFLHGPSGCGKSSLLGIIAGVLKAQEGTVRVLDENFTLCPSRVRDKVRGEKMGYIFQMFNLIPYLSVFENIILPCELNKNRGNFNRDKTSLKENVLFLCQKFKIESLLNNKVSHISIGQQQRVAAARALLGNPQLIIADEPTSALDAELQSIFIENLLEQCETQRSALLFVSHDKRLAKNFDREVSLPQLNRVSK